MQSVPARRFRIGVEACLGLFAAVLCWVAVCWAFRPGQFPVLDELGNVAPFLYASYHQVIHLLPTWLYNDRPLGFAFQRLLFDWYGYNYAREVPFLLAVHFANCIMGFALFRRLGAGVPIALAGIALYGTLWTTAQTATYLGAAFDVLCLFFLLGSTLAFLWEKRGASILSAILFLAALRTKEFAMFTPLLLTVLGYPRLPSMPFRQTVIALARRLWLHYLIALLIALRYLSLVPRYLALLAPNNPYRMELHTTTLLSSLAYYISLVFGAEDSNWRPLPWVFAAVLAVALGWALFRRRAGIAFAICAFVLYLQPISLMPHQRAVYYVYAPQLFLILALCLLAETALAAFGKPESLRWTAAVCIALTCMSWCVHSRRAAYFRNRVNFFVNIRRTCMRSARDATAQLPRLGPETHVYVNHREGTLPWLFLPPCAYLRVVNQQRAIDCTSDRPSAQLRTLYEADPGPKYLIDYRDDGSFAVEASDPVISPGLQHRQQVE
jgi:hypothetical protein